MNRTEHLLSILAEECNEVAQRAIKAQRFGLLEVQPDMPEPQRSNIFRLREELADLFGVMEMLESETGQSVWPLEDDVEAKKLKVKKYMAYAESQGALHP